MRRSQVIAAEGVMLVVLATGYLITGRFLGTAILLALGGLAVCSAWMLWPTGR